MKIPKIFKGTQDGKTVDWLTVDDAQEQFEKFLKAQSVVYSEESSDEWYTYPAGHDVRAFLVCVQEIPKPCVHEPDTDGNFVVQLGNIKCKHCGAHLKPPERWEEV